METMPAADARVAYWIVARNSAPDPIRRANAQRRLDAARTARFEARLTAWGNPA